MLACADSCALLCLVGVLDADSSQSFLLQVPGMAQSEPASSVVQSAAASRPDFVLPEGCVCSVRYDETDPKRFYTWKYKSACPVAADLHPMWLEPFRDAFRLGEGMCMVKRDDVAGCIIIDSGRVCMDVSQQLCVLCTDLLAFSGGMCRIACGGPSALQKSSCVVFVGLSFRTGGRLGAVGRLHRTSTQAAPYLAR